MTDRNIEAIVAGGSPVRAIEGADGHLVERRVRSESVYEGHFLKVRRDEIRLPNGKTAWREHVVHPGAVMIVPIADDGLLVIERQYRYPLDRVLLEFPAGKLDPNETTLHCAQRELREETGLTAGRMTHLTTFQIAYGVMNQKHHLFLAEGLTLGDTEPDPEEHDLTLHRYSVDDFERMLLDGTIVDNCTAAAWGIYLVWKRARE